LENRRQGINWRK